MTPPALTTQQTRLLALLRNDVDQRLPAWMADAHDWQALLDAGAVQSGVFCIAHDWRGQLTEVPGYALAEGDYEPV